MLEFLLIARMDCVRVLCFRNKNLVQAAGFPLQGRKEHVLFSGLYCEAPQWPLVCH